MTDERSLDVARRLTISYTVASTVILAASGLLGVVLRWSQAVPQARIGDNFWYALMTAHGLGAFVGWAGFAVMGLAWWILASIGFPVRGFGLGMARVTWWLMVLGVAGVIVTTIFMGFGASWVFLYPLPFYGSGNWGNWATGLFSFSVLLAGLAIVTWCFGILHTVTNREALDSVSGSIGKRLGISFGWGFLMPKTFATTKKRVPYPVVPLAVIGLDMIIATLPLAGLLIWQILQSMGIVGSANALLAKNILRWFGHPVVYLLLFPAAAAYYWLIPRYAGRDLVAGHVIAIAWTVAVIANVFVWAHHLYLDYPSGTPQAQINTAMQPITFALVLPSALSLYSLAFFGLWLVQGLDGAPRRWSVLPSEYDSLTRVSLVFAFLLAAAQALFFWNVLQTLRGKAGVATFDERGIPIPATSKSDWSVHVAEGVLVLVALLLAFAFAVGGFLVGREHGKGGGTTSVTTQGTTGGGVAAGDPAKGEAVFASAGCGGCHTLAAAGATGAVGPSLDGNANLSQDLVVMRVTNGIAAMPPFKDQLSEQQIQNVVAYVIENAKK